MAHSEDHTVHQEEDDDLGYVGADEVQEVVDDESEQPQAMSDNEEDDMGEELPEGFVQPARNDAVSGFLAHQEPVYAVAVHPTQEMIVLTGGGDDKAYLWRSDTADPLFELGQHTDSVVAVAFSSDGEYAATGGMDGKIFVHKAANGQHVATLDGPSEITWLNWHPRGNVLLAGSEDATLWMWQIPSGNCMGVFTGHVESVSCGQFTPDGKHVVSGSADGSVIIWDPKSASATLRLTGADARFHEAPITSLAIHHDSNLLLTGAQDGTARLVHIGNGRILAALDNHSDSVEAVGFCKCLPLAATGSVDGKISIWDITNMQLRQTVQHDDAVTGIAWHATEPYFTSISADRSVRVWDARTGECMKTFLGHQATILDLALTRDGRTIITGSDDGQALVFHV
ncbi:hypothetical protein HDU85_002836 [Gaertneriomyces sp. JEL0708]|nr:hypothetical protein HDU85_002836 [Gaertneriomyces sp. JEL0708]